ncbi:hypothetical protein TNCV_2342871 [Trichonephila clavipes]|nr:hypothetical protein TNCV_2342871 [Trichonephila clavipes]
MNLPQPPTRFSPYGKRILNAAKLVYEDSIQKMLRRKLFVKMKSYYGSAIREITAVFRICGKLSGPFFLHKLSTDEYPQHGFCPIGEDSWCGFKKAEASGVTDHASQNKYVRAMVEEEIP